MKKYTEIDSNETDSENKDGETFTWLHKNKNKIERMIEEFDERGNNYFKHCNKEKIETIQTWCDELLNEESKIFKNKENLKTTDKVLAPVGLIVDKLADSNYPISKRRKLLQEVQVGNGIMGVMSTVVLPYNKQLLRSSKILL